MTSMNEGVRRAIQGAHDIAARNVAYLDKEIVKAECDQSRLIDKVAEMREERRRNRATVTEAEAMLNGR